MRRLVVCGSVLIGLTLVFPTDVSAQKKKRKGGVPATPQEYSQLVAAREALGTIVAADDKSITFQVDFQHTEPNPKYRPPKAGNPGDLQKRYNELLRDQIELAKAKTPAEQQRRLLEYHRDMAALKEQLGRAQLQAAKAASDPNNRPIMIVSVTKQFELDLSDKVVCRRANPAFDYDDKGNIKTYTREDLAKLRGDGKLPGYEASLTDLSPGTTARISVGPPGKGTPKGANLLDEIEGTVAASNRPTVSMIMIVDEIGGLPSLGSGKK